MTQTQARTNFLTYTKLPNNQQTHMNTPSISELRQISLSHAIMHNSPKSMFVVLSSCLLQLQSPKKLLHIGPKEGKKQNNYPIILSPNLPALVASSTLFLIFPSLLLLMPNLTHSCRRTSSFFIPALLEKYYYHVNMLWHLFQLYLITPVQALSLYFKIKAPERNA